MLVVKSAGAGHDLYVLSMSSKPNTRRTQVHLHVGCRRTNFPKLLPVIVRAASDFHPNPLGALNVQAHWWWMMALSVFNWWVKLRSKVIRMFSNLLIIKEGNERRHSKEPLLWSFILQTCIEFSLWAGHCGRTFKLPNFTFLLSR